MERGGRERKEEEGEIVGWDLEKQGDELKSNKKQVEGEAGGEMGGGEGYKWVDKKIEIIKALRTHIDINILWASSLWKCGSHTWAMAQQSARAAAPKN